MADLIDRRQREAAALLLSAIDLPAPVPEWSRQLLQAAKVCPGIKVDQACLSSRRAGLTRAREIIDELLAEIG